MKVSFDASGFTKEQLLAAALPKKLRARIWRRIRVVSFEAERFIKIRMPVDTGAARASWGHSTAPALPGDGIWDEQPEALMLTQGSRLEYIERLNEGSSTQAPAGFIDAIERQAAENLADGLEQDVDDAFR